MILKSPERKSGIVRVIAVEEDTERKVLEAAGELFEEKKEFQENEIEKTPEQKGVIVFINQKLPEFVRRYGAEPLAVLEDKVHLMAEKAFRKKQYIAGFYCADDQSIYIKDDPTRTLRLWAQIITHEFMHFNAFQSLLVKKEGEELDFVEFQRRGLKIRKEEKKNSWYFQSLDEAIIEELTKRFMNEFLKSAPLFKKDNEAIEQFKHHKNEIGVSLGLDEKEMDKIIADLVYVTISKTEDETGEDYDLAYYTHPHQKERQALNDLVTDIYEKNKKDFQSAEEVFVLFAQATMSDRFLPLGRLIEKTYGKGSFRKLGKKFSGKMEKRII